MAAPEDEHGSFSIRHHGSDFAPSRATMSGPSTSRSNAPTATAAIEDAPATPSHVPIHHTTRDAQSRHSPTLNRASPTTPPPSPMQSKPLILDRKFWQRRVRAGAYWGLTVGSITDTLGLRRPYRTRGRQTFSGAAAQQLAEAVAVLASRLPSDAERLVEIALETGLLKAITEYLVERHGEGIWGDDEEGRERELYGVGEVEGWKRGLRVGDEGDREVINEQLRLWILVKGFNSFLYQKSKTSTPKKKKGADAELDDEDATYDRAYWTQRLERPSSSTLDVRAIITSLNIQRYDTGSDGKVQFEHTNVRDLSETISKIADTLPQDEEAFIDTATDSEALQPEVDGLLLRFGHKIWGGDQWQRLPMHEDDEYDPEDLVYAKPGDMKKISHFLRLWILVRAFDSVSGKQDDDSMAQDEDVDATLLPFEASHGKDEEEELALDDVDRSPTKPDSHCGVYEEDEVVLDDFSDDIEEVSEDSWMSTTRVRPAKDQGSHFSNPVEPVKAPVRADKLAQNTPERPEMSPLSEVPDDDEASPMAVNTDTSIASTASPDHQVDPTSVQIAHAEAASIVEQIVHDATMVPGVAIASIPSPLPPSEQPVRSAEATVVGDFPVRDASVASASKAKAKSAKVGTMPMRSVRSTRNLLATYNEAILDGRARHTPTKYLENHHKNVMRGSPADVAQRKPHDTASTPKPETAKHIPAKHAENHRKKALRGSRPDVTPSAPHPTASTPKPETVRFGRDGIDLDVTKQWDESVWRRFASANVVHVLKFMSSLGLKARQNNSGGIADNLACDKLMKEVNKAAAELCAQSPIDELVDMAADYTVFDEGIAMLIDKYAKDLWTPGAARPHLLQAGNDEAYAKELDGKNEVDRKALLLHLHQWIFAKAFANFRRPSVTVKARIDGSISIDKPDEESASAEQETPNPKARQRVTWGSNKVKTSTRKRKATSKSSPPNQPRAKVQKSSTRDASVIAARALTTAMLTYSKLDEDDVGREADLLNHIEAQTVLYAPVSTYPFPQAIKSWLTYRRIILAVRKQVSASQSSGSSEVRNKIMRARLLTDLRLARDAFVAMRVDGLGCEEYLCWAFEKMAEGEKEGKEVRREVEEGFKMLDERLRVLADGLGRGEWVFMG